jgi:hypothetical protein
VTISGTVPPAGFWNALPSPATVAVQSERRPMPRQVSLAYWAVGAMLYWYGWIARPSARVVPLIAPWK